MRNDVGRSKWSFHRETQRTKFKNINFRNLRGLRDLLRKYPFGVRMKGPPGFRHTRESGYPG